MKASIVIATYNRAEDLGRCLDSVLVQQNCDIEIIVVNDASTDSTQSLIEVVTSPLSPRVMTNDTRRHPKTRSKAYKVDVLTYI